MFKILVGIITLTVSSTAFSFNHYSSFDKSRRDLSFCTSAKDCREKIEVAKIKRQEYKKWTEEFCNDNNDYWDCRFKFLVEESNTANWIAELNSAEQLFKQRVVEENNHKKIIAESERRKSLPGVRIGMTSKQVLEQSSWGKPNSINRTTTAHGTREQWVYGHPNYLYFTNGVLTSIQN